MPSSNELPFKKTIPLLGLCIGMLLLTGCASTIQYVHFPDQSKTIETAGKARLYVMFPYTTDHATAGINTFEEKTKIGMNAPNSYLCWETEPGTKTISSKVTGVFGRSARLEVALQADHVYFLKQNLNPFNFGSLSMQLLSDGEGQKVRSQCVPPGE